MTLAFPRITLSRSQMYAFAEEAVQELPRQQIDEFSRLRYLKLKYPRLYGLSEASNTDLLAILVVQRIRYDEGMPFYRPRETEWAPYIVPLVVPKCLQMN